VCPVARFLAEGDGSGVQKCFPPGVTLAFDRTVLSEDASCRRRGSRQVPLVGADGNAAPATTFACFRYEPTMFNASTSSFRYVARPPKQLKSTLRRRVVPVPGGRPGASCRKLRVLRQSAPG